jgi:alpha,alpha-trehalase
MTSRWDAFGITLYTGEFLTIDLAHEDKRTASASFRPVVDYIRNGWDELTRSMDDCASLTDVKVASHQILYLPHGYVEPDRVRTLSGTCDVRICTLPRRIEQMGDVTPEDLPAPGLLYLPHPYIVPGGRFNEMYGWDSYFILLGLMSSGLHDIAKNMVENLLFEVEYYGTVLNANRTYYLTRSQPPYLAAMIRAFYEDKHSFSDRSSALEWLAYAYQQAARYYETWKRPEHCAGETGLARYFDLDKGPIPELGDDAKYFHDVINWLLEHPKEDPGYLERAPDSGDNSAPNTGCSAQTGVAHEQASVNGHRLTADFYLGDRAMRESGFDTSFRFGPFSGSTHHYAPVCLNSLLYRYERDMAKLAQELGDTQGVVQWNLRADNRADAIHKYLWNENAGTFRDYNFIDESSSTYSYLSIYYPLWAGLATKDEAAALVKQLPIFEHPGGLAMSSAASGMQWDEPFGWAPMNWVTVKGLFDYGYADDAFRIARAFLDTVTSSFSGDATVREKYDVERGDANVHVAAGYKQNVIGFGWTNGVYLKMLELLTDNSR